MDVRGMWNNEKTEYSEREGDKNSMVSFILFLQ